jgi:hypothetical protein
MNSSVDAGQTRPPKAETGLITSGRDTKAQKGFVNPPVVHGATVLYPDSCTRIRASSSTAVLTSYHQGAASRR